MTAPWRSARGSSRLATPAATGDMSSLAGVTMPSAVASASFSHPPRHHRGGRRGPRERESESIRARSSRRSLPREPLGTGCGGVAEHMQRSGARDDEQELACPNGGSLACGAPLADGDLVVAHHDVALGVRRAVEHALAGVARGDAFEVIDAPGGRHGAARTLGRMSRRGRCARSWRRHRARARRRNQQ